MLPLLLEWDVAHGETKEFRVKSIAKVSGKAGTLSANSFRYLLEIECLERDSSFRYLMPSSAGALAEGEDSSQGIAGAGEGAPLSEVQGRLTESLDPHRLASTCQAVLPEHRGKAATSTRSYTARAELEISRVVKYS